MTEMMLTVMEVDLHIFSRRRHFSIFHGGVGPPPFSFIGGWPSATSDRGWPPVFQSMFYEDGVSPPFSNQ